nr:uncharacterized protein LOC114826230 [Malus domestica]
MLDASAGGALVDKTPVAAKTLIANRALNAQQYKGIGQRDLPRQQVNEFMEGCKTQGFSPSVCGICSIQGHPSDKCPQLIENGGWESANAIGYQGLNQPRYDPYANTYNPGWRDHPNFKGSKIKTMLNQAKEVDELKKQMGQMAKFMEQFKEQGKLSSTTVVNPRGGFESAKAITLRSGKKVGTNPQPSKSTQTKDEKLQQEEDVQHMPMARKETTLPCTLSIPKSSTTVENRKDVRSCFAIDVIANIGQERSAPIKNEIFQTTIEKGIGVEHNEHAPTLKKPNLAESTPCACVDSTATSLQHIGEPPPSISIPISNNMLSHSLVQLPTCIQGGKRVHINLRKQNTTIRKDHYHFPFKDPKHEVFRGAGCGGNTPLCHRLQ